MDLYGERKITIALFCHLDVQSYCFREIDILDSKGYTDNLLSDPSKWLAKFPNFKEKLRMR